MPVFRDLIEAKILELAKKPRMFFPVVRNAIGEIEQTDPQIGESVLPASATCGETNWSFAMSRNKREYCLEKTNWMFELIMVFNQEVDSSNFDEEISSGLLGDGNIFLLKPIRATAEHPPKFNPANGSKLIYIFEAVLLRK